MDKSRDTLPFLELRNHKFVMTAAGSNELAVVIFIAKGFLVFSLGTNSSKSPIAMK